MVVGYYCMGADTINLPIDFAVKARNLMKYLISNFSLP